MSVSIIAAVASNGVIGCQGALPWHLPDDLAHFKALTIGHTVIMGRKTYESLPYGALPHRRNIVLSRLGSSFDGAETYASLHEALAHCASNEDVFIIGGASVYSEALPIAIRLFITLVDQAPRGDVFFPAINENDWQQIKKEKHNGFSFVEYVRK